MNTEVIIVGAGPVGLLVAAELRLAGVDVVVLERLAEPNPHPKALGLHARTLEQLAMRGLAEPFLSGGVKVPAWHFGFLEQRLDLTRMDTPFPFMLAFPQHRTEALLAGRALELGARIVRGAAVTGVIQSGDRVRVDTDGQSWEAGWVVGADGAGSTVRKAAGIGFPGTDADTFAYLGDVHADAPPAPGYGMQNERGALIVAHLPGGLLRFTGFDPLRQDPANRELTMEELGETVERISGVEFGLRDPEWLTRFGNATRVAADFRRGRVLLAGDSAHMHFPAGGVGLNLGLQDAMNLGWKLAAVVQGRAADTLLDTYSAERRPWAADVAEHTLAQTALITATNPTGQALRALLSGLVRTLPDLSLVLARRLSALDVHYPAPGAHPLVGTRVADALLLEGKPLVSGRTLIRPDGYVWWATEGEDNPPDLGVTFRD
ncbi:FAD-dependent monooxygenase [Actinoplanes sp. NPDC051343]|uniref:FAD-dependent monooxygenase n=1 Tax=Actinoplanes sp. NPDC051343 TaxID=3363906 RepID=UPI0037BDB66D